MRIILNIIFTTFIFTTLIFSQSDSIRYTFRIDKPGLGLVSAFEGVIHEGEQIRINEHQFSSNDSLIQKAYDLLAGGVLGFDDNCINESMDLYFTIGNFNPENFGYSSLGGQKLFLYFEVAIVGDSSLAHPANTDYYLNEGKYAYLKIPFSNAFFSFLDRIGFERNGGFRFAYYKDDNFTSNEIETDTIPGAPGKPDTLMAKFRHFSKFSGGGTTLGNTTSVEKNTSDLISDYQLRQNYPNPFNPSTTIRYKIPEEGFVSMKLYNVLGSEIRTLVSEVKSAGEHNINFNASGLHSGIYMYMLKVNGYLETKKMLYLK